MNSHLLYDASRLFSASKLSFPPCMIIFKVYLDLELLPIVDLSWPCMGWGMSQEYLLSIPLTVSLPGFGTSRSFSFSFIISLWKMVHLFINKYYLRTSFFWYSHIVS